MYTYEELAKLPFHDFVNPVSLLKFLQDHNMSTAHFFVSQKAADTMKASMKAMGDRFDFAPVPVELKALGVKYLMKGMPIWILPDQFTSVNQLSVFVAIPQDQIKDIGHMLSKPASYFVESLLNARERYRTVLQVKDIKVASDGKVFGIVNYLPGSSISVVEFSEEEMEKIKAAFMNKDPQELTIVPKKQEPEFEFVSTKSYHHNVGLSCAFRQWRATHSHCSKLHGYSVAVSFKFGCRQLDDKNWAADFGGLKELKKILEETFDHKTIVAADDPHLEWFIKGSELGVLDLIIMKNGVGCERFAEYAFNHAQAIIESHYGNRVWVEECEVREHEGNSAIYRLKR